MAWDRGRYYTRSRKVNGRVVREYVGCGEIGERAAKADARERKRRASEREAWLAEKQQIEAVEQAVGRVCEAADVIAKAAMLVAGFYFHKGEWRRRHVTRHSRRSP
jgi:hypothetical protein